MVVLVLAMLVMWVMLMLRERCIPPPPKRFPSHTGLGVCVSHVRAGCCNLTLRACNNPERNFVCLPPP